MRRFIRCNLCPSFVLVPTSFSNRPFPASPVLHCCRQLNCSADSMKSRIRPAGVPKIMDIELIVGREELDVSSLPHYGICSEASLARSIYHYQTDRFRTAGSVPVANSLFPPTLLSSNTVQSVTCLLSTSRSSAQWDHSLPCYQ